MADSQQSRFEKSLGLLTARFVSLLQKAKDGVLDLKAVSIRLRGTTQKVNLNNEVKLSRAYTPFWVAGILKEVFGHGIIGVYSVGSQTRGFRLLCTAPCWLSDRS